MALDALLDRLGVPPAKTEESQLDLVERRIRRLEAALAEAREERERLLTDNPRRRP
jgi:hypothetical protein